VHRIIRWCVEEAELSVSTFMRFFCLGAASRHTCSSTYLISSQGRTRTTRLGCKRRDDDDDDWRLRRRVWRRGHVACIYARQAHASERYVYVGSGSLSLPDRELPPCFFHWTSWRAPIRFHARTEEMSSPVFNIYLRALIAHNRTIDPDVPILSVRATIVRGVRARAHWTAATP